MMHFINWIKVGYYDFCELPLGLKVDINPDIALCPYQDEKGTCYSDGND